ncbi:MAG: ABC transporter ATP-binding protein [Opitutales bacterium]|nr:ABC transporter ATP-binding protein [Opitutales bacterium]
MQALDGVDLTLREGRALGIVGESGSGKSTLARILVGLEEPSSGTVLFQGKPLVEALRARSAFHREVQFVFQNSLGALNPRKRIGSILHTHLQILEGGTATEVKARVREVAEAVDLPEDLLERFPHALSGGQAQRVNLARALLTHPRVIVMDEPVAALDVSVQARVLRLLRRLAETFTFTLVFITHDLAVVDYLCDEVCVMREGKVVESGSTADVLTRPHEAYTRALMDASRATSHGMPS